MPKFYISSHSPDFDTGHKKLPKQTLLLKIRSGDRPTGKLYFIVYAFRITAADATHWLNDPFRHNLFFGKQR